MEVAVVHLDDQGNLTREWCSLVNPDRDLGPQSVHGISAAEARRAPTFGQLAGQIAELLKDRVVVAHNLSFDARFLTAEFERLGIAVPIDAASGLCTMRLASHFLPAAGRGLRDCRRLLDLPDHQAHSALDDALAAADLMVYYLAAAGASPPWRDLVAEAASWHWPDVPVTTVASVPRNRPGARREHFLKRLVEELPRSREPRADSYLDLLDQALLDHHISESEADALLAIAEELGLWQDDVARLHREYLCGLAAVALDDQILTLAEREDLERVAQLLGLDRGAVDDALTAASNGGMRNCRRESWQLRANDVVVFTGSMEPARDQWEEQARSAGLQVGKSVTRKTRLTVAADPDSMSGKAKQARRYGIPIVHPSGYQRLLADLRDGR
uniref:DNA polymerase III, epsilon subunit n=1 Tax=Micromonospora echinospora TaxID=1877 RepID=Q2MG35_MICEC|nr:DNA polymerase III, epsilon subunit [Micromonospora echinospora]